MQVSLAFSFDCEGRQLVSCCVQTIDRMQPETEGVPSKRMAGLQIDGYLPTAKANLELTGALDRIKVLQLSCCRDVA